MTCQVFVNYVSVWRELNNSRLFGNPRGAWAIAVWGGPNGQGVDFRVAEECWRYLSRFEIKLDTSLDVGATLPMVLQRMTNQLLWCSQEKIVEMHPRWQTLRQHVLLCTDEARKLKRPLETSAGRCLSSHPSFRAAFCSCQLEWRKISKPQKAWNHARTARRQFQSGVKVSDLPRHIREWTWWSWCYSPAVLNCILSHVSMSQTSARLPSGVRHKSKIVWTSLATSKRCRRHSMSSKTSLTHAFYGPQTLHLITWNHLLY